jgi:hypothetical protein
MAKSTPKKVCNADGTLENQDVTKPNQARYARGFTLHHMIDKVVLRDFWNTLLLVRDHEAIAWYAEIIGASADIRARINHRITRSLPPDLEEADLKPLAESIIWQPFNLFQGPANEPRPGHAPDPHHTPKSFKRADHFDFPPVCDPHGKRVNDLWLAYGHMTTFIAQQDQAKGPLNACLHLLAKVAGLGVIQARDVNWFAVEQPLFWSMSPLQRQQLYDACMAIGVGANGNEVYQSLFGG